MPVHLLGGTASPPAAREVMRRLASLLPKVRTVSLIGLGHMGPIAAPDRVRAHLPEWMLGEATAPATPDWATPAATSIAPRDMPQALGLQAA